MPTESAPRSISPVAGELLRAVLGVRDAADRDLLARFARSRDEDAFAELVRRHGAALGDAQDLLAQRLNQEVDRPIQRQIREILRSDDTDADKAEKLKHAADTSRLVPRESPPPYPPIGLDDIRLICWTAVHS